MEETKFKFMWGSICFIVFWLGLIFVGSWVNTPTSFSAYHYFTIDADNETKKSLISLAKIKEAEDQQCIVKEYATIEYCDNTQCWDTYHLINEYMVENCSYTQN